MRFFQKRVNNLKKNMPLPLKYLGLIESGTPAENLATRGCLRPRKIFVYNSFTCKNEPLYVDCGHCARCKDQRRNEWSTRMVLHAKSEPWRNRYFITLTYGSYNLYLYKKHPFMKDWKSTFPVFDAYNSRHKKAWTPSLLNPQHFTKFMKRLRAALPEHRISYCVCGELGGDYGRPHFHSILYSDKPITREDIVNAWSLDSYEKTKGEVTQYYGKMCPSARRFRFHIGRVDYHDLTANGSCDFDSTKNPNEAGNLIAKNAFQYVAKYCVKDTSKINKYAIMRYKAAYEKLETTIDYVDNHFTKCCLFTKPLVYHDSLLAEEDFAKIHNDVEQYLANSPLFTYIPPFLIDYIINKSYIRKKVKKNGKTYEKITFNEFLKLFGTYFSTSRMYSIGKDYFLQNVEQFESGNFSLRKVQGKTLVFPSYFYRLLEAKRFGIRFRSRVESGTSLTKGILPIVYQYFANLREYRFYSRISTNHFLATHSPLFSECNNKVRHEANGLINPYLPNKGTLLDITLSHGTCKNVNYVYSDDLDSFIGLEYDRKAKNYFPCDYISRIDMCDLVLNAIKELDDNFDLHESRKQNKLLLYEKIYNNVNIDLEPEISNFESARSRQQALYDSEHFTKDNM